jgi:hypothetical protein
VDLRTAVVVDLDRELGLLEARILVANLVGAARLQDLSIQGQVNTTLGTHRHTGVAKVEQGVTAPGIESTKKPGERRRKRQERRKGRGKGWKKR